MVKTLLTKNPSTKFKNFNISLLSLRLFCCSRAENIFYLSKIYTKELCPILYQATGKNFGAINDKICSKIQTEKIYQRNVSLNTA